MSHDGIMYRVLELEENALTHTLTHTTISASGQGRMYWTYDLWVSSKTAAKTAKSRCVATES